MLTLNPSPTFKAKVGIPVPGADKPTMVEFVFKGMTRTQLQQWFADSRDRTDDERIPLIVEGWSGVDTPYSEEALIRLLDMYAGAAAAIVTKFRDEITGARLGN